MNYFELHIGDLTEATAHLSMLEDGAYGRLLRKYYATEKPLPADIAVVQRIVGARSKDERQAVVDVLGEFFELQDDGWHQSRCDAEIAAFHAKQVGREGAKESAKERQRRARERRKELFAALKGHGIVPPWTTVTADLETMLSRVTGGGTSVTGSDSSRVTGGTRHGVVTATQTPDTNLQTPDTSHQEENPPAARVPPPPDGARPAKKCPAGFVLTPELREWAASNHPGVNVDHETEKLRDHTFATARSDWPGTWRNWIRKASEGRPTNGAPRQSVVDRQVATMNALTGGRSTHHAEPAKRDADDAGVVDVVARLVP